MVKKISILNDEGLDLGAWCARGFVSYTILRLIDNRPSLICLWPESGDGLALSSESIDLVDRLEVGIIRVARANKDEVWGGAEEVRLSSTFLSPTTVFVLQTADSGFVFENGIYLLTRAGGEIQITSANYPHALSFKIDERSKDYEPEYLAPDYRYVELTCESSPRSKGT